MKRAGRYITSIKNTLCTASKKSDYRQQYRTIDSEEKIQTCLIAQSPKANVTETVLKNKENYYALGF